MGAHAGTCFGSGRRLPSPGRGPQPEPGCWLGLVPGKRCPQRDAQAGAASQFREQRPGTRSRMCGTGELRHEAVVSGGRPEQSDQQRRLSRVNTSPPIVRRDDLPMLQAQASKLRATIMRRTACAGASNQADNVAAIISHYSSVLAEIEEQIRQLKDAAEPAPAVPASGHAAAGKKHESFDAGEAEVPGNLSVLSRPVADSVSTVATDSTACSLSGEPQA